LLLGLSDNGRESLNLIPDPDADSVHHRNLTTSRLVPVQPSLKISAESACNFLCNFAIKPTAG